MLEEEKCNFGMTLCCSMVKRRVSVLQYGVDLRSSTQQYADLIDITAHRRHLEWRIAINSPLIHIDLPPLKWSSEYHRMAIEEEAGDAQETAFDRGDHRQAS